MSRHVNPTAGTIKEIAEDAAHAPLNASIEFTQDNAFLLYASFCGDAVRTAAAANMSVDSVLALAASGGWDERLRSILELKKSQRPGDIERGINRALNFVTAHRLRLILESVIRRITAMSPEELREATTSRHLGKDGVVISENLNTRALADLAAALEKCNLLSYMALGDDATSRRARPDIESGEETAGSLHAKIAAAFAKPAKPEG